MTTYKLVYADDGIGSARKVEFEAVDAAHALIVAQREACGRRAQLWADTRLLCNLSRTSGASDLWIVEPG